MLFLGRRLAPLLFLPAVLTCALPAPAIGEEDGPGALTEDDHSPSLLSSKPTGQKVPWESYLKMAADKLDCYLTLELLYNDDRASHALAQSDVRDDREVSSIEELIEIVSRDVKGISFLRNARQGSIIHVIDDRLKSIPDYSLEKTITIDFSGTLNWLTTVELPKRLPGIGERRGGLRGEDVADYATRVTLNVKDQKLRDVLTDCVPLEVYKSILWRAETSCVDGQSKTTVRYYGVDTPRPGHGPERVYRAVFWQEFAEAVAQKLDCYLTIEKLTTWSEGPGVPLRWSSLNAKCLPRAFADRPPKDIDEFMELLRRELEGVRVVRDADHPKVIHLVDEPLLKIDGYFMAEKVDLDYSGTLGGMLTALETQHPCLGLKTKVRRAMDTKTEVVEVVGDKVTPVRVAVKDKAVRSLLTESVPLEGYQRLLWQSETALGEGKYSSWVRYSGPIMANIPLGAGTAPPASVAATTAACAHLLARFAQGFARANKEEGPVTPAQTTWWFPFYELSRGRFGAVVHTGAPREDRNAFESRHGPLREVLLGEFRLLVVVHPDNPIQKLDGGQLDRLLRDGADTWKLVGGHDRNVVCYLEDEDSASREMIQWKFMVRTTVYGGSRHPFRKDATACASPMELVERVAADRSGLGVFLYDPDDGRVQRRLKGVKVLPVGKTARGPFVMPALEPVLQDGCPLNERVVMYVHPNAPPVLDKFSDFCLSPAGLRIAAIHGLITPPRFSRSIRRVPATARP